ncbi:MAG: hypothetical protein JWR39_644 [Devosia sp.]|jgi:hypothetical protein|nr:hypothetical protein [Devosia sp.]
MIPTRVHGIIDYIVGIVLILAPFILGFADGTAAQWVPIIIGVATLGLGMITRHEMGLVKLVPMTTHIVIDVISGLLLLVSPWLFGFADRIWWPHVLVGLMYIVISLMTARHSPVEHRVTA